MANLPPTPARSARVTLDQVAAQAGVGRTTVSDILHRNNASRYSDDVCQRVRQAVERLGYTPARAAQNLARGRSGQLGLLLTRDFTNPYFARVASVAEREITALRYRLQLAFTNGDAQQELDRIRQMKADAVEGLLVGPVYERYDLDQHRNVFRGQIPIVIFGAQLKSEFDEVTLDHAAARRLAIRHLRSLGHRRIGFLCAPPPRAGIAASTRWAEMVTEEGGHCAGWVFEQPDTGLYADYAAVAARFAAAWKAATPQERPTAVVCLNDQVALAALAELAAAGIRVPQDLALVGHDNSPESAHLLPSLTTVDSHIEQQMKAAVDLLIRRIRTPQAPHAEVIVPPSLIVRASTEPSRER